MTYFQNLDLGQVGLPDTPQHFQSIVSALNEFQSIGVLRTPEEKLACLVQTIRVTSTLSGGADDLIPILLLTVLRSGISNLASNLYYMKNFVLFGDASRGEYGYSLSTLEAVSRYILTHVKQLSPLSARNQEYWETICRGDIEGLMAMNTRMFDISNIQPARPIPSRQVSSASLESGSDMSIHSTLQVSRAASPMHSRDAEGNNGLLLACKSQQVDMLRYLLEEQGSSIVVSNYEGKTPLMMAIEMENVELARVILGALARHDKDAINRQDVLGNTGMHMAAAKGHSTLMDELLKFDSNLGLPNNDGDTPLIIASKLSEKSDQYRGAVHLLSSRMKCEELDRQNNRGDTAIHFITDTELMNHLVQCGANPDVVNYAGWTPLLKWALHDNAAVVNCLLETGQVNVLMVDSRGYSPLHMACLRGNLEMVQMLHTHTPIDFQSGIDGSTPLQLACQSNSASVVEFLLQSGANPELRDWSNESPADMTSDSVILDMLDNSMLFWESSQCDGAATVKASNSSIQKEITSSSDKSVSNATGKRLIRVVRGAVEQDGKIRYIVKSGSVSLHCGWL
jgi:ankyrin repeat protein